MARQASGQHLHLATRHLVDLHGSRVLHEPEDGVGDLLIGVDYQVVVGAIEQGSHLGAPQRTRLHPDDSLGHAGPTGQQGAHDVRLVDRRHGDQQVGLLDARRRERHRIGAAPPEGHDVQVLVHLTEAFCVRLDQDHVVALAAEAFGNVGADLAGTHHDYAHGPILPHGRVAGVAIPWPASFWRPTTRSASRPDQAGVGHQQVHGHVPGA